MPMQPLRSLLFVPGNKPTWMEKALQYGADALILDLEDSVPGSDKPSARVHVRQALERLHDRGPLLAVRINALDTGLAGDDLDAILCPGLTAIVAPKVETPHDVVVLDTLLTQGERRADMALGQVEIFPTLETAKGIYHAYHIASSSARVPTLCGTAGQGGDTARSLGYVWSQAGSETLYIRSKVLLEARAAGVTYPLMASWFNITDLEGLRADARLNRQLGYSGQVVIHPTHVPVVNEPKSKKKLSKRDMKKFVTPEVRQKLHAVGWTDEQIREQVTFTDGRIIPVGASHTRKQGKRADYILRYRLDFPLAVVEAKAETWSELDALMPSI